MVGQFGAIDEREQRMGFAGAHDLCSSSVMLVADVDDDRIISYSDDIKLDVERVKETQGDAFGAFWKAAVDAYVDESAKEDVRQFLSASHLRSSFEQRRMTEAIEYPCIVAGDTLWLRACYELSKDEQGHIRVQVLLIDMTRHQAPDDLERM